MPSNKRELICLSCGTGYIDDLHILDIHQLLKLFKQPDYLSTYRCILKPCCTDPNLIWDRLEYLPYPFENELSETLRCSENLDESKLVAVML
jgi:hypothetical protein